MTLTGYLTLEDRTHRAHLIISQINAKLPLGFPFEGMDQSKIPRNTKILVALEEAKRIKCRTDRDRTIDMVKSMVNIFTEFIHKQEWSDMKVCEFEKKHAQAFLDYAIDDRGVGNRTHNNYIERMRALFTELVDREYVAKNPFSGFKKEENYRQTATGL